MRTRREAKPPRPPRIITARLVRVAMVVGVVLAVGSVPVGVAVGRIPWVARQRHVTGQALIFEDRYIRVTREGAPTISLVACSSAGGASTLRRNPSHPARDAMVVESDPRPRLARAWLDAHGGDVLSMFAGWPFRAAYRQNLASQAWFDSGGRVGAPVERGVWKLTAFGSAWIIPTIPYWPGLLGNTLFYGLLVLTPIAFWRWRKLRRRARRGLCVACGYELGAGVDACPECGLARRGS